MSSLFLTPSTVAIPQLQGPDRSEYTHRMFFHQYTGNAISISVCINAVNIKKAKKQETKIKFYTLEFLEDLWEYKAVLKDTCNSLTALLGWDFTWRGGVN